MPKDKLTNWDMVRLGDVCTIRRGSSPRPILNYINSFSGMPWVKIADATEDSSRHINKTNQFIKETGVCKSVIVEKGDLILSNSGTAGLPKFMNIRACIHDGWQVFIGYNGITKEFLYYYLLHIRASLLHNAYDSTMKNLTLDMLREYRFFLPPLLEQESIALTLSCLDDKIELNAQMNKTLEEMAQAIFKSWFVDFDPFKDGEFEDSELGKIPKGWKVGKLSDIADIVMGQSPEGTSYNEEGNGEIFYQGRGEFNWRFPTQRLFTTEPKRMAEIGDILMSVRAPVGDINVSMDRCCIGRGLSKIRSKNNHQSFVLYLMKNLKQQFTIYNGEGTVFGSINKDTLNDLKIVLPIISSVNKFEHIVSAYDEKILRNTIETEQLKNLRDYLLPKLMSGEIRVPLEKK